MSKYTYPLSVSGLTDVAQLACTLDQNMRDLELWLSAQPSASSAAYTASNVTVDRTFDADTVAVAELADVVGTLIADLQAAGMLR